MLVDVIDRMIEMVALRVFTCNEEWGFDSGCCIYGVLGWKYLAGLGCVAQACAKNEHMYRTNIKKQ